MAITLTPVEALVHERLERDGRLTFAQFMELALYHLQVGYYSTCAEIGPDGDFITSPELHPGFGALLGRQAEDCWQALGRPSPFYLREFGAGRGALCRDLLRWARSAAPNLADALECQIVERSAGLREIQQRTLDQAGLSNARVTWATPDTQQPTPNTQNPILGTPFDGLVLSNELLDSFPVHLVTVRNGQLRELYVSRRPSAPSIQCLTPDPQHPAPSTQHSALTLVEDEPSTPELAAYFERLGLWPGEGCRAEVNLEAVRWMAATASSLRRGLVLTLDYGYPASALYAPSRRHGTLLCYYRHTLSSDPFQRVGRQDMTTHVDFTTLAATGERHGLTTLGLVSQARLLGALGLNSYLERLESLLPAERQANRRALLELIDPQGLGRIGALFQQRALDGYVPLGLQSQTPPPDPAYLPLLPVDAPACPSPEQLDGLSDSDIEAMWRAFVSGGEGSDR